MVKKVTRREFLVAVGLAGTGAAVVLPVLAQSKPQSVREAGSVTLPEVGKAQITQPLPTPPITQPVGYSFLTSEEAAFIEAAISRLIPADSLGPGALEAGVSYFIDQQLSGELGWGPADRWYMEGPFGTGTSYQGYQLRLDPVHLYQMGIKDVNAYTQGQYGHTFAELQPADQDAVLKGLEAGTIKLANVPSDQFFSTLRTNTTEGFFADPIYGGNRDKAGWRLVGFPGVPVRGYMELVTEYQNKPYVTEPVSIADVLQGVVSSHM